MSSTARRRPWGPPLVLAAMLALALVPAFAAPAATLAGEENALAGAEPKDRTLHRLQAGVHALREQRLDASAQHFDAALEAIESVFSSGEGAAKARSLWYEEGAKDFKGEPYERAMAFYYRGLLYLIEADYENARASFRSALMQSSFAEEQHYRSGFATLMFLEGWANQLLKDTQAREAYAEAARYRPGWQAPAADANTLVIAELAGSPRKSATASATTRSSTAAPAARPRRSSMSRWTRGRRCACSASRTCTTRPRTAVRARSTASSTARCRSRRRPATSAKPWARWPPKARSSTPASAARPDVRSAAWPRRARSSR